jgi:hypothetical protein
MQLKSVYIRDSESPLPDVRNIHSVSLITDRSSTYYMYTIQFWKLFPWGHGSGNSLSLHHKESVWTIMMISLYFLSSKPHSEHYGRSCMWIQEPLSVITQNIWKNNDDGYTHWRLCLNLMLVGTWCIHTCMSGAIYFMCPVVKMASGAKHLHIYQPLMIPEYSH